MTRMESVTLVSHLSARQAQALHCSTARESGKGSTPHTGGKETNSRRESTQISNSSVTTQCEPSSSTVVLRRPRVGEWESHRTKAGTRPMAGGRGRESPTPASPLSAVRAELKHYTAPPHEGGCNTTPRQERGGQRPESEIGVRGHESLTPASHLDASRTRARQCSIARGWESNTSLRW